MKNYTRLLAIYFAVFSFLTSTVRAQTTWTVLSAPRTSSAFIASSFINDNEGWIKSSGNLLWHTTDGCKTIDTICTGKYFSKLDFVDALIGYAVDPDNVFKTTDGGVTWTTLSMPGSFQQVIFFLNKDTGFVSGTSVYYRTIDGGSSWETLPMPSTTLWNDYYFINDSTGCAVTADYAYGYEIYRTTDCGLTWTPVNEDNESHLYSIWFAGNDTGWAAGYYDFGDSYNEIFKTTDGGLTWKVAFESQNWFVGNPYKDIRFKSNHKQGFVTGFDEYTYCMDGKGWAWWDTDTLSLPNGAETWYGGLFNSLDGFDDMFAFGKNGTVLKWKKDSAQWQDMSGRIASDINDVSFTSKNNGWIATTSGVLKTDDGGDTWSAAGHPSINMTNVEAVNDSFAIGCGSNYQLYRTLDGGQTWNNVDTTGQWWWVTDIQMIDAQTGFLTDIVNLWKTTDGGNTWQAQLIDSNAWPQAMSFINSAEGWVISSGFMPNSNNLYHTQDSSNSWTNIYSYSGTDYEFRNIFFIDSQHGFLTTNGKEYFESFDGGITWIAKKIEGVNDYSKVYFANSMNGYFLTNHDGWPTVKSDLYQTNDGGITWWKSYSSEVELYDIEYADSGEIFARGFYGFLVRGTSDYPLGVATQDIGGNDCRIFPNPFSSSTTIEFTLSEPSHCSIRLFSLEGKEAMTISEETFSEGRHQINLDRRNLLPGIYFLEFQTSSDTYIQKVVIH